MNTSTPQPGIFAVGTPAHHHLEYDVVDASQLMTTLADVTRTQTTVNGVNVVVGIEPTLWKRLSPNPNQVPPDVHPFTEITSADGYSMPATQRALWVWIHGSSTGSVLDHARTVTRVLAPAASHATEQASFVYGASQDLTGFEDGTENPSVGDAVDVACIPPGEPGAGCAIALVQRWVHDLEAFGALPVPDQEEVIGRTKIDSVELDDTRQPADSHVSRVVIEDEDGEEEEVWRRSTPFANVSTQGLMFIGFTRDQSILQKMLGRMAGVDDGVRDRLTDYSKPTSGAWYITPPLDALAGN